MSLYTTLLSITPSLSPPFSASTPALSCLLPAPPPPPAPPFVLAFVLPDPFVLAVLAPFGFVLLLLPPPFVLTLPARPRKFAPPPAPLALGPAPASVPSRLRLRHAPGTSAMHTSVAFRNTTSVPTWTKPAKWCGIGSFTSSTRTHGSCLKRSDCSRRKTLG